MNYKYLLTFVGGLLIGGATGVFATRKYFETKANKRADEEIDSILREYCDIREDYISDEKENEEEPKPSNNGDASIRRHIPRKREDIDYTKFYKESSFDPAEQEHPMDDGEEEQYGESVEEQEANLYHQRNKGKEPEIISDEELLKLPSFIDHHVMFYYMEDNMVTDEDDLIIDDPDRLFGVCLHRDAFVRGEEKVFYIMNYELDTCYELEKINGRFAE